MKELTVSIGDAFDVAVAKLGIEGWTPYRWEAATGGHLVTGAVPFGVYARGDKKGLPRFHHPKASSRQTVVVSDNEIKAQAEKYEAETGHCWNCKGTGQRQAGWSAKEGIRYQSCKRCGGTGLIYRRASAGIPQPYCRRQENGKAHRGGE